MWTSIPDTLFTEPIASVIRWNLLLGDVLSTVAVGFGIVWENGPSDVRKVADRLVLWGIVAETLCSVALFTFDESVSSAQQSKIIALETRIADRYLDWHSDRLLKGHPSAKVEIMYVEDDADSSMLRLELEGVLDRAKWPRESIPIKRNADPGLTGSGPPVGVTLLKRPGAISLAEAGAMMRIASDVTPPSPDTPIVVLWSALSRSLGFIKFSSDRSNELDADTIRVVIGPKQ